MPSPREKGASAAEEAAVASGAVAADSAAEGVAVASGDVAADLADVEGEVLEEVAVDAADLEVGSLMDD